MATTYVNYGKVVVSSALQRLENIAAAIERRSSFWPILAFLPFYLVITVITAKRRLLWDDEFFTMYISRPDSMKGIEEILKTGADQHPPLFYYLTHQITALLGLSHLTLRLLSIAGFALMCFCLFYLLYRRTSILWAFLGMVLPLGSTAFYYATESRGYALMLGSCSLALLSWQRITSHSRRRYSWLVTLFLACGMAVSSHYYAILFVFALSVGELARSVQLKKFDVLVWVAFLGGIVPLVAFLEVIQSARQYAAHFWAYPKWGSLVDFHVKVFGGIANILVLGSIPYLIAILRSDRDEIDTRTEVGRFSTYEVVAWASITAIPLFAMLLAKTITHGYIERYAMSAVIGAVMLVCHCGYAIAPRPRSFPLVLSAATLLYFVFLNIRTIQVYGMATTVFAETTHLLDFHPSSDVVIGNPMLFHRLSFYAPRRMVRNVAYVADPDASVFYLEKDTIDHGLLDLRPWFPENIVPRAVFTSEHRNFFVYSNLDSWTWLTYVLVPPHYQATVLGRYYSDVYLSVRRMDDPIGVPLAYAPVVRTEMMFDRVSNDGPSLCKQWMPGDDFCDLIEERRQNVTLNGRGEPIYQY